MTRTPLLAALLLLLAPACRMRDATRPEDDPAARVNALADAYLEALFERKPEDATVYGVKGRRHDRLTDHTPAAIARREQEDDRWLEELRRIDAKALAGRPEAVTYGRLREALESSAAMRVCRNELWAIDQLGGWQSELSVVASVQPVGSGAMREQALSRFGALPEYIEVQISNLRQGLTKGYSAPRGNVKLVLGQIEALLTTAPEKSPFYDPAARDDDPAFKAAFRALVADRVNPALRRYRDFLASEYLASAREQIAVAANPAGDACYRAATRKFSTLDLSPKEIHELGLAQMAQIEAEMRVIAERTFGSPDVRAALERLKTDRAYMFKSREEVLEYSRAALGRARREMPRWFGLEPSADVVVERYPEFRERAAVGEYTPPAEDGSRPGVFLVSTYDPENRSRSGPESVAFHETIPGHHLQIATALEHAKGHPLSKYVSYTGYVEGWALYAERLADEMGLFSSDVDRMGMLSEQALRAARLVIDPGIHALGWSRAQAIEYLGARTTIPKDEVEAEIDRYIVWPGQATGYMLGQLELLRLREEAKGALGPRFDIRQFHDRVLEDGAVPLPVLREKIHAWLEAERAGAR